VQPAPFTSVLSIDLEGLIDMNYVHALYGMSKVSSPYFSWLFAGFNQLIRIRTLAQQVSD
jgi:hypothetical protein